MAPCQVAPLSGPPYGYEYPFGSVDPSGRGSAGVRSGSGADSAPALRCSVIRAAACAPARYAAMAPARAADFRSGCSAADSVAPEAPAAPVAMWSL